jgi:hypothetical protein
VYGYPLTNFSMQHGQVLSQFLQTPTSSGAARALQNCKRFVLNYCMGPLILLSIRATVFFLFRCGRIFFTLSGSIKICYILVEINAFVLISLKSSFPKNSLKIVRLVNLQCTWKYFQNLRLHNVSIHIYCNDAPQDPTI